MNINLVILKSVLLPSCTIPCTWYCCLPQQCPCALTCLPKQNLILDHRVCLYNNESFTICYIFMNVETKIHFGSGSKGREKSSGQRHFSLFHYAWQELLINNKTEACWNSFTFSGCIKGTNWNKPKITNKLGISSLSTACSKAQLMDELMEAGKKPWETVLRTLTWLWKQNWCEQVHNHSTYSALDKHLERLMKANRGHW